MLTLNRRSFLKTAALAAGTTLISRPGFAQETPPPPGKRLNLAFIGAGGIARVAFEGCLGENYVAMCDVDDNRAAKYYGEYPNARRFRDFRKMFDAMHREIDAVIISTPDHTHFPAAMVAMQLGKPVYVQKPLAHNIWQCRTLKKAARHHKVISQMGNQGHATAGIRLVKEWYQSGVLGAVREVHAWFDGPLFESGPFFKIPPSFPPPKSAVPEGFDWDLWQGPAAKAKFSSSYHPLTWRGWWAYGCAELGDWACHTLDAPFWSLGLGQPTKVEVLSVDTLHPTFTPRSSRLLFHFAARGDQPPVKLYWYDGGNKPALEALPHWPAETPLPKSGMVMVGEKCSLMTGPRPDSPQLLPEPLWQEFRQNPPAPTIPRVKGGPFKEWLAAIKGDGPLPGSNFDYSAELTEMSLVGVLATRLGKTVEWDAAAMRVTNHKGLEKWVKEPTRRGWSYGEGFWK